MSLESNYIRNEIKGHLATRGFKLKEVVAKMNEQRDSGEQTTVQNISNKLSRGTIKYSEVLEIAQIIGMTVTWETINKEKREI